MAISLRTRGKSPLHNKDLIARDLDFIMRRHGNVRTTLEVNTMALIRWEPARELQSIQQEMNRLFGSFFDSPTGGGNGGGLRRWIPAMDLVEEGDHYALRADL